MGVISSAGKALGRKAAKKSAAKSAGKAATKKAAPKAAKKTAAEWDAEFAAIEGQARRQARVGGAMLAAAPVAYLGGVSYEMDKVKERKAKEARARLPQGADKFGWAGRR